MNKQLYFGWLGEDMSRKTLIQESKRVKLSPEIPAFLLPRALAKRTTIPDRNPG